MEYLNSSITNNPDIVVTEYSNYINIKMDKFDINVDTENNYKVVREDNDIKNMLSVRMNEQTEINLDILNIETKEELDYDDFDYDDFDYDNDDYDLINDYDIEEHYKHIIDYDELRSAMNDFRAENKKINVPRELLNNKIQIIKMLINEIKKVNSNFDYPHYISSTDNPFEFIINFVFDGDINIEILITFDSVLYPFIPPSLNVISTNINNKLFHSLNNIELFKLGNWNPVITLDWIIRNLGNKLEQVIYDNIEEQDDNDYIKQLIQFDSSVEELLIVLEHNKFSFSNKNDSNKNYWASGTGYGHSSNANKWDIKDFIKQQEYEIQKQIDILDKINNLVDESEYNNPILLKFIRNKIDGSSLIEINKNEKLYTLLHTILDKMIRCLNEEYNLFFIDIINSFDKFINEIQRIKKHEQKYIYDLIISNHCSLLSKNLIEDVQEEKKEEQEELSFSDFIQEEQEKMFDDYEIQQSHRYYKNTPTVIKSSISRIMSELNTIQSALPNFWDTSIIFRSSDEEIYKFSFVITGPVDTPYHNGIFEFHGIFSNDYPNSPPKILINTTGGGTVRYNPNLYANGKVCLSLLGTWSGDETEKWNSSTSTLLQVLISIQSLIFVDEPYFNEPGYERSMGSNSGNKNSFEYNDKVRMNTLRWAMVEQLRNPPYGFEDFTRRYFIFKREEINDIVEKWIEESRSYGDVMRQLLDEFNSLF